MSAGSRGIGSPRRSWPTRSFRPMIFPASGRKAVGSIHMSWANIDALQRIREAKRSASLVIFVTLLAKIPEGYLCVSVVDAVTNHRDTETQRLRSGWILHGRNVVSPMSL